MCDLIRHFSIFFAFECTAPVDLNGNMIMTESLNGISSNEIGSTMHPAQSVFEAALFNTNPVSSNTNFFGDLTTFQRQAGEPSASVNTSNHGNTFHNVHINEANFNATTNGLMNSFGNATLCQPSNPQNINHFEHFANNAASGAKTNKSLLQKFCGSFMKTKKVVSDNIELALDEITSKLESL